MITATNCVCLHTFGTQQMVYSHSPQNANIALVIYTYVYRLLDLVADRRDKRGKSGKVLINGQRRPANYKTMVGYVVQVKCYVCAIVV